MKNKPAAASEPAQTNTPESPGSRETFPERSKKPRAAGLANEARPGLGTRSDNTDPARENPDVTAAAADADRDEKPRATPHGYEEPRPEPREQSSDPFTQEQERSTGVSGHSGNT